MDVVAYKMEWTTSHPILVDNSNTYGNYTEAEWREYFYTVLCATRESYITRMVMFTLFVSFGIIGNITLLFVILRNKQFRNSPNILISNLALADLIYILVVGPLRIEHEIHPCWMQDVALCALKNYAPVVCQCACIYSLVALSRERYSAIVTGFKTHVSSKTTTQTVCWAVAAWILGIVFAAPILTPKFSYMTHEILCSYVKRGSLPAKIYEGVKVLVLYFIPVVIILLHYLLMTKTLLKSTKNFTANNSRQFIKQLIARKRLAYLSIALSVFFVIFWLPSYVYTLTYHFKPQEEKDFTNAFFVFRQVHYFMSLANSSLNPYLVFLLSSKHRNCLSKSIRFTCASRVMSGYVGVSQSVPLKSIVANNVVSVTLEENVENEQIEAV